MTNLKNRLAKARKPGKPIGDVLSHLAPMTPAEHRQEADAALRRHEAAVKGDATAKDAPPK